MGGKYLSIYGKWTEDALTCRQIQSNCAICNIPADFKPYCKMKETIKAIEENIGAPPEVICLTCQAYNLGNCSKNSKRDPDTVKICKDYKPKEIIGQCKDCTNLIKKESRFGCRSGSRMTNPNYVKNCSFYKKEEIMPAKHTELVLAPREIEVLKLYIEGKGDIEISEIMNLSGSAPSVYFTQMKNKFKKFNVIEFKPHLSDRVQIAEYAKNNIFNKIMPEKSVNKVKLPTEITDARCSNCKKDECPGCSIDDELNKKETENFDINTKNSEKPEQSKISTETKKEQYFAAFPDKKEETRIPEKLTAQESAILALLCEGCGYSEIAKRLFITEQTVKTHINNIFQKLQVNDRTNAVLYALRTGLCVIEGIKIKEPEAKIDISCNPPKTGILPPIITPQVQVIKEKPDYETPINKVKDNYQNALGTVLQAIGLMMLDESTTKADTYELKIEAQKIQQKLKLIEEIKQEVISHAGL